MTLTAQQVFDTAYLGVMRQGALSKGDRASCYYRHPTLPLKCAVGHLIDDTLADAWEGLTVGYNMNLPHALSPHRDLLMNLQEAHDASDNLGEFQERAEKVARDHKLVMPT